MAFAINTRYKTLKKLLPSFQRQINALGQHLLSVGVNASKLFYTRIFKGLKMPVLMLAR